MTNRVFFGPGNYHYLPGVYQYSAGVVAATGYEIVHARFIKPQALSTGFEKISAHLNARGLPLTALCACELRSPAQFSEAAFRAFNEQYVGTLTRWGIFKDNTNPVARSNVCPELEPPTEPGFYAFSFTVPTSHTDPTCIVAGSGEVPEGKNNYADHIVAPGDTSATGMRQKADYVIGEMQRRLSALGMSGQTVTSAQVYTVHPIHDLITSKFSGSGLEAHGLVWHYARPPIVGLDFEMDARVTRSEIFVG